MSIKGLENKKFGKLTVIKKNGKTWECKCDCGKIVNVKTANLRGGHVTSCGCKKYPNLIGKKFYRLTVLRLIGVVKNRRLWECKCDCGNIIKAFNQKLTCGRLQSCGCKKKEDTIKRQWQGYGEISGSLWTRIVNQAKSRKFDVKITIRDIWNLFLKQDKKCNLTSLPLRFSSSYHSSDGTASLDRINSKLGYVKGNIQWVHKDINQMKMDMDEKYFVELCRKIVEKYDKEVEQK